MISLSTPAVVGAAVVAAVAAWIVLSWQRRKRRRQSSPQDAYTLGLSALINGDRGEALRRLKDAVQADTENIDAYLRLGDLLRESGEVQKALAIHRDLTVRARLRETDRGRILESLTRDYLASGRHEEAGQSAERLLRLDRRNRFAYRALQQVAEALQDWPRALRVVEERAKTDGQGDRALLARYRGFVGGEELAAGNVKEARRHFEEAIKLDPQCLLAYLHLGDLDQAEGHAEKAIERWRTLALTAPDRAGLVFERLERAYFELGKFEEVVTFYRELLARAPRDASAPALLALAEIYRRKGDLASAESFIQDALEVEPDSPRAHRHLAKIDLDRRDPRAALAHLDRVLEKMPARGDAAQCRHCGTPLAGPVWRCPSCRALNPQGF